MQSLDVISLNFWQIFVSLCNLLILFLVVKKFLFKPVEKMLAKRQEEIDVQYAKADEALKNAEKVKNEWDDKISSAESTADGIINTASDNARKDGQRIISMAKAEAEIIINNAKTDAELERKRANDDIKKEITEVSALISEKILEREINTEDHKLLIDSFISGIGEDE